MKHPSPDTTIHAYWQPCCTSCLRMKEFLARHGVPFVSVNVLEDEAGVAARGAPATRGPPACSSSSSAGACRGAGGDAEPLKEGAYGRVPAPGADNKAAILAYGADVLRRFEAWRQGRAATTNFTQKAHVYYGDVTLHDYLERTVWHSGQHVRQMVMVLGLLGITPDRPPTAATFAGLAMPEKVGDDRAE